MTEVIFTIAHLRSKFKLLCSFYLPVALSAGRIKDMLKKFLALFFPSSSQPELEVHADTLNDFFIATLFLGGLVMLRAFISQAGEGFPTAAASITLFIGAWGSRRFRSIHFQAAWYWLVLFYIIAIGFLSLAFPDSPARFYYPITILVSSLLVTRAGIILFSILAGITQLIVATSLGYPATDMNAAVGPLTLILGTAIASFLASRQLRVALETAENFSARTREMLEEIRTQRVELTKTVRALAQANTRLERLNIELEEARKTAVEADRFKSEFLAHMSHELRTPLNAILNFTAFVADGLMGDVTQEQVETLQKVIDSGNHLLSLINDVLDISKIEAGLMNLFIEDVDMNASLNTTVSMAKGLLKNKPLELITDIENDLPHINGDRRRIRQIFLNLVSNAVKFTPEGSITISAHHAEDKILVSVKDTGIGIAPEDMASVFEPFKQAKHELRNVIGTGLGLPISKHFVEAHGGRIWVESQKGSGATFFVSLPVNYLRIEETAAGASSQPPPSQEK